MKQEREEIEIIVKCSKCGSMNLNRDDSRGELVCEDCGLVLEEDTIDSGPEWRAFNEEERKERIHTGPPETHMFHDKGLSTIIDKINRDYSGNRIPHKNVAQLYRMREWQKRSRFSTGKEKNLAAALVELNRMASSIGLPRAVRETAAFIYRKAVKKNLHRGREVKIIASAALYAACRQCNVPRTLDEIINPSSGILRKEVGRAYRVLSRNLSLRIKIASPKEYIKRFCDELKLSNEVLNKTIEIMEMLEKADSKDLVVGHNPTGTAGAVIYIASHICKEGRTQKQVADVVDVTEVTVRNRYKAIQEGLGIGELVDGRYR